MKMIRFSDEGRVQGLVVLLFGEVAVAAGGGVGLAEAVLFGDSPRPRGRHRPAGRPLLRSAPARHQCRHVDHLLACGPLGR